MTIDNRIRRSQFFLGADTVITFTVDLEAGDNLEAWTYEFVIRDLESACLDPRNDKGTGALRLTIEDAQITPNQAARTVTVPLTGAAQTAAGLEAADYFAGLNRIDVGNTRPLARLVPLHFTGWAQGD